VANSFVFDPNRCTGCDACRLACTIENELAPGNSFRRVETFNERHRPDLPLYHVSLACNHCREAACMDACPALAYSRDPATGAVVLDGDKCVGCKYCAWACPFDAPVFDAGQGVMTKCDLCRDHREEGRNPACVDACQMRVLSVDDFTAGIDGDDAVFPLPPANLTEPSTALVPHRDVKRAEREDPRVGNEEEI